MWQSWYKGFLLGLTAEINAHSYDRIDKEFLVANVTFNTLIFAKLGQYLDLK